MPVHIHYDGRTYTAPNLDMDTALTDLWKVISASTTTRGIYKVETTNGKVMLLVSPKIPIAFEELDSDAEASFIL